MIAVMRSATQAAGNAHPVPLRIAYCSYYHHPPDFGGATIRETRTLTCLADLGDRVTVYTSGRPGFPPLERRGNLVCHRSPIVGESRFCRALRRILFSFWLLLRLFLTPRVDVVFLGVLSPTTALCATLCCRLRRLDTLMAFTLVGEKDTLGLDDLSPVARAASVTQMRFTNGIVTNSNALYDAACARFGQSKVRLIYNGTRADIFRPGSPSGRAQVRQSQGADNGTVVFSFMGSLTERKGFDVLLSAFDRVVEVLPTCRLWVIGPRSRNENHNLADNQVESLLSKCRNLNQVQLFGRIDDPQRVAAILSASDVFVFPSRREGFPNALIEAMSCGLPVLVNRLPGVTDIAPVDGETGFLFENCNPGRLAELMLLLAGDTALRSHLGFNARQRVLQEFNFDRYVNRWRMAFRDLRVNGSCQLHPKESPTLP